MTCAELADVAAELALGVLTGRERAVAIAHLDTCDACREHVRQLMATGDQLRALLPPAEPPAGFETRVLERLGLPVLVQHESAQDAGGDSDGQEARPSQIPAPKDTPPRRRTGRDTTRPGAGQPGAPQARPDGTRHDGTRPHGARPDGARPDGTRPGTRRPGRMRRMLAAAAVGLAIIVAGVGGWRFGVVTAPTAAGPLSAATLLSATHQNVGRVFVYSGTPGWLYMSVDLGSGNGAVTCQVIGENGQVTTVGSFRLADGFGAWGSPNPGYLGELSGARLVAPNGAVIASGTFNNS
jgi:hypothetical protein